MIAQLRRQSGLTAWFRKPKLAPRWWWHHHFESMIVSGMAAHIAFFAFGAAGIWPDLYAGQPWWLMLLPWVVPVPIAFGAIALLQRHYRRKFAGTDASSAEVANGTSSARGTIG